MFRRAGATLIETTIVIVVVAVLTLLLFAVADFSSKAVKTRTLDRGVSSEAKSTDPSLINDATSRIKEAGKSVSPSLAVNSDLGYDPNAAEKLMKKSAAEVGASKTAEGAHAAQKIIYEAEVSLVVEKFADVEAQIRALLEQYDGYVAEATIDRRQGEQVSGRWRVRVPIDRFEPFLDAVSKLGVAESQHQTAQDVTAEFIDLSAQIANKKQLEERIVELLKHSTGQIKDVIEVEHELARVRGEIEQMEGRLRYLTNRTDYTTVSIAAREVHEYVPAEAPTFVSRVADSWHDSIQSMREFGQRSVISSVGAVPWIMLACVAAIPIWWLGKRIVTRRRLAKDAMSNTAPLDS